ncbi:hypothetical protein LIQ46_12065, partial [Megasphaera elsdenii]|uniref:hypothetical protein n=1 Tax=Megasphaera elsdenii TaxID=907 RepID=UPI001D032395
FISPPKEAGDFLQNQVKKTSKSIEYLITYTSMLICISLGIISYVSKIRIRQQTTNKKRTMHRENFSLCIVLFPIRYSMVR